MADDFPAAFVALRGILKGHSGGMVVQSDTPTDFSVYTRSLGPSKKPMWFGAVQLKKSAVTYHLMPLYYNPALQAAVDSDLSARKQGKTCFNFRRVDAALFAKLAALTARGREQWERHGFLEPGPIPPERFEAALRAAGEDPAALARVRKIKGKQSAARRAATIRKKKLSPVETGKVQDSPPRRKVRGKDS